MSRHWRRVSKVTQKLATGWLEIKSEGTFPYETYYVLATDSEFKRLYDREQRSLPRYRNYARSPPDQDRLSSSQR